MLTLPLVQTSQYKIQPDKPKRTKLWAFTLNERNKFWMATTTTNTSKNTRATFAFGDVFLEFYLFILFLMICRLPFGKCGIQWNAFFRVFSICLCSLSLVEFYNAIHVNKQNKTKRTWFHISFLMQPTNFVCKFCIFVYLSWLCLALPSIVKNIIYGWKLRSA